MSIGFSEMIMSTSVAIICPTKDRPDKVRQLLASIVASDVQPGQIIIADGGNNLKPVVAEFADKLVLTCLYCPSQGQIMQRNHAHTHLLPGIELVLHLDDDITLEADALAKALAHWNEIQALPGKPLGGMAFNIIDHPAKRNNLFRSLALMKVEPQGRVWASGFASPHVPVSENTFSQWLIGGATMWARDVLESHPHPLSFQTRWAFCEDVLYSYPLSKTHRLAVCAAARAKHNDTYNNHPFAKRRFYAKTQVLMRNYLVALNADLSSFALIWMAVCQMFAYLAKGMFGDWRDIGSFLGTVDGIILVLRAGVFRQSAEILVRGLVK